MTVVFKRKILIFLVFVFTSFLVSACDVTKTPKPYQELAEDILAEAVSIKSVDDGTGSTVALSNALAQRLLDAGFPTNDVVVAGPRPEVGNVIARYRGDRTGGEPIIVMAHLDVVDALPSDWTRDPFTLEKDDTYFYGRGVADNKAGVSILLANFIRLYQEGYVPNRDIIMVLTGDEETTGASINWLANERRNLIDAEFALNSDSGWGLSVNGEYSEFNIQAAEKMSLSLDFTVRDSGGHSSIPGPNNAIFKLVEGLKNLDGFSFPIQTNEITKSQLTQTASTLGGRMETAILAVLNEQATEEEVNLVSSDSYFNALLRTTCVPTMLRGGHAKNALPQTAVVTVNCRIFPGVSAEEVEAKLLEVMAIEGLELERLNVPVPSDASPINSEVFDPLKVTVDKHFGEIPIVTYLSAWATDGLYLRNVGIPVYGVSALFSELDEENNVHGMDEKLRIKSYFEALSFWYDLIKGYTGGGP